MPPVQCPHLRSAEWVRCLEDVGPLLCRARRELDEEEYLLTLRSFLTRLLKQPRERVMASIDTEVPMGEEGEAYTLRYLLEDLPRPKLLRAFRGALSAA